MSVHEPIKEQQPAPVGGIHRLLRYFGMRKSSDMIIANVGDGVTETIVGKNIIKVGTLNIPFWALAILALVLVSSIYMATFYIIHVLKPAPFSGPMQGDFNVVVAAFGTLDAGENAQIHKSDDGSEIANQLAQRLADDAPQSIYASRGKLEARFIDTVITGKTLQERQHQAATIADENRADVVIYGYFDAGRQFIPEFYTSPRLAGAEEMYAVQPSANQNENSGVDSFGSPIEVLVPFQKDVDRRNFTNNQVRPRFDALSKFMFGLAMLKGQQYQSAMQLFLQAGSVEDAWKDDHGTDRGKEILYLWMGTALNKHALFKDKDLDCPQELRSIPAAQDVALKGDWLCAWAAYTQAISINNTFARAYIGLGNVLFYQAEIYNSAGATQKSCDLYKDAVIFYQKVYSAGMVSADTAYIHAKTSYDLGLVYANAFRNRCGDAYYALARASLEQAVQDYRDQPDTTLMRQIGAHSLYQLGLVYRSYHQYAEATKVFIESTKVAGQFTSNDEWWQTVRWNSYSQLGQTYIDLAKAGDTSSWQPAIDAYTHIIDDYQAHETNDLALASDAYYSLGVIYNLRHQYKAAIYVLEQGVAIVEDYHLDTAYNQSFIWYLYLELGDAYIKSGFGQKDLYVKAGENYQKVIVHFSPNIAKLNSRDVYILALSYCRARKTDQLLGDTQKLTELDQTTSSYASLRGFQNMCTDLDR